VLNPLPIHGKTLSNNQKGAVDQMVEGGTLPKRPLGKTGEHVSVLGLGGEGLMRSFDREEEAVSLIHRAIDLGVTYFESARAYAGSESYYGSALGERRKEIFLASKSHERTEEGLLKHLEVTLKNMDTDFLDLWMAHDVRSVSDLDLLFGSNGGAKAFEVARQNKLVKWVGISGHRNPTVLSRALDLFPFDAVLLPVNPGEFHYRPFLNEILPKAQKKGMGILGMKVFSHGAAPKIYGAELMEKFLRFSLAQPISTAVIGYETIQQLEMNVRIARSYQPMTKTEQENLIDRVKYYARELTYYKF
jgi:aryl-alcohol dehydrogenase-like predicted oxidoreductase